MMNAMPSQKPLVMKEDVTLNMDMITIITKILYEKKKLGILIITDKYLKLDSMTPKHLRDKINSFFIKIKDQDSEMNEESRADVTVANKSYYLPLDIPKAKDPDTLLIEEEFEALLNRDIFIRRGRNNRILAKLITKDIFGEES